MFKFYKKVSIGSGWNYAQFDNFKLNHSSSCPKADVKAIFMATCDGSPVQTWKFSQGKIISEANSSLCLTAATSKSGSSVVLLSCSQGTDTQLWKLVGDTIVLSSYPSICLDITGANASQCAPVEVWSCNGGANQQWNFNPDGTIGSGLNGFCLNTKI